MHSPAPRWRNLTTWQLALALLGLLMAARIAQLAYAPTADCRIAPRSSSAGESAMAAAAVPPLTPPFKGGEKVDAELAEFYSMCPMAAVVDLKTVAESPEQVDRLLPPYRETADRQPASQTAPALPVEPAVPRIRYPVRLRSDAARVALAPKTAAGATTAAGDWLIEPKEWYGAEGVAPGAGGLLEPSPSGRGQGEGPGSTGLTPGLPMGEGELGDSPLTQPFDAPPQLPTVAPDSGAPPSPPALRSMGELPAPPEVRASEAGNSNQIFPAPSGDESLTKVDPHLELFAKNAYPSARECAQCHEDIYHEWSISAHAYAAVSPMFHKFEQKLNDLSQGTVGYFCVRCHAPVATAMCASRAEPLWNLPEVAREGVTCIACHRVQYVYGKSNGERRIEPGNIFAPVFGGIGGDGVAETIHRKEHFKVKTSDNVAVARGTVPFCSEESAKSGQSPSGPGQNIHAAGIYFEPLTKSEFCTPCHQVAVHPGIKLEVVWEQYRASPACKKGISCQDCHMGRVPGLPLGYNTGPVAKMADKTVNDCRKKSNHIFYGPNYPIAHPGVFPFHLKANRWTMPEWLAFDWRAGWGTEDFENRVADGQLNVCFPEVWAEADDRYDAREIIDENFKKLGHKRDIRIEIMENGSHVEGPFFHSSLCRGEDLRFHYIVTNTNEGHNLLTASLGAQPQFWANVVLTGPDGCRLWESGYLDSYGDLANIHSEDVRNHRIPFDRQLFNLQTMFLITGAKGTDREFFVPVNVDIDQLPFIRPGVQPITVINHPPFIRMESQSLAPLGSRRATYKIPGHLVQQPGTYRLSFRMRSRAEPIYLMRFCDATPEMIRSMNEWMVDVHPQTVEFEVR